MILMAPCIIDFIWANALLGPVGGGGPGHSWALKWPRESLVGDIPARDGKTTNLFLQCGAARYNYGCTRMVAAADMVMNGARLQPDVG